MKKILLLVLGILMGAHSFAQDPDLFQTWYLYTIEFENGDILYVGSYNPPIDPDLTVNSDFSFFGNGACNTFEGSFNYSPPNGLEVVTFSRTSDICGGNEDMFEDEYFAMFSPGNGMGFTITTEPNGDQTLVLGGGPFIILTYGNVALSNSDFRREKLKIYPNPVSSELFIASENIQIENIRVYSISGKQIFEISNFENSFDVSTLSEGVYFIEIQSPEGKSIQKFIKLSQ